MELVVIGLCGLKQRAQIYIFFAYGDIESCFAPVVRLGFVLWRLAAYHIRIIQTTEMMMPMPQRQASAISNCRSRD